MYNITHTNKIENTLVIEWDIYNYCNQNCFYCEKQENNNPHWNKKSNYNEQLKIVEIFNCYNNSWPLRIHMLGGEPSIYPNIYNILNKLNDDIYIKLYTNNRKPLILNNIIKNIDLHILMSFHPSEIDINTFTSNIEYYINNNFFKFEVVIIFSDIKYLNTCVQLISYLNDNKIMYDIYSIFDFDGKYFFDQNSESIIGILKNNIEYDNDFITYQELSKKISPYGYMCNKNIYFLDIYGNLTSHLIKNDVNLLTDCDFLNNIKLKDHYCPNTNCYTPPDSYYPKNKATLKDKIKAQYDKS